MKKIFIFMTCLLSFIVHAGELQILNLNTMRPSTDRIKVTTPKKVITKLSDGYEVTYTFTNIAILYNVDENHNAKISIDGFGDNTNVGEPTYLTRIDRFLIPENSTYTVSLIDSQYVDIDVPLVPVKTPDTDNSNTSTTLTDLTSKRPIVGGFNFPGYQVKSKDITEYRGTLIGNIEVCPIQYLGKENKTRVFKTLKYKVTLSSQTDAGSSTKYMGRISENDVILSNMNLDYYVLNDLAEYSPQATSIPMRNSWTDSYLIITTSKYKEAADRFANWKMKLGYNTIIKTNDNWTSELISNSVRETYNKNIGLYYLLIIGSNNDVPALYTQAATSTTIGDPIKNFYSDYQYGCIGDDNDKLQDIQVGRLPVNNLSEAYTVVDKLINYEQNPPESPDFYKNISLFAYFQDNNNDGFEDRRFVRTSDDISNYILSQVSSHTNIDYNVSEMYRADPGINPTNWNNTSYDFGGRMPFYLSGNSYDWNLTTSKISDKLNEGSILTLYRGHGNYDSWSSLKYNTKHVKTLANGKLLPVILNMTCKTGTFDEPDCISSAFLTNSNGGAVGVLGASEVSYSGYNDAFSIGCINAIWPKPGIRVKFPMQISSGITPQSKPVSRIGDIISLGHQYASETWTSPDRSFYSRKIFHYFGDPSMRIYTESPTEFKNISIKPLKIVELTKPYFNIEVNDEEIIDLRISFLNKTTGEIMSSNRSGTYFPYGNNDDFIITITGKNKIPYIVENISSQNKISKVEQASLINEEYTWHYIDRYYHYLDNTSGESGIKDDSSHLYYRFNGEEHRNGKTYHRLFEKRIPAKESNGQNPVFDFDNESPTYLIRQEGNNYYMLLNSDSEAAPYGSSSIESHIYDFGSPIESVYKICPEEKDGIFPEGYNRPALFLNDIEIRKWTAITSAGFNYDVQYAGIFEAIPELGCIYSGTLPNPGLIGEDPDCDIATINCILYDVKDSDGKYVYLREDNSVSLSRINPEKSGLRFDGNKVIAENAERINIYNMTGQCVLSANAEEVQTSDLQKGIYLAEAIGNGRARHIKILIK